MNPERLAKLQQQVRIGGKGSARRKKKVVHRSSTTDDKKLQSSLKKLGINNITGIEEVNMIKDDGSVIHFNNPKVQASLNANTFAVSGHAETKQMSDMLPGILNHLGADGFHQLKKLATSVNTGNVSTHSVDDDDDDVPELVQDFETASKSDVGTVSARVVDDDIPELVQDFESASKSDEAGAPGSSVDGRAENGPTDDDIPPLIPITDDGDRDLPIEAKETGVTSVSEASEKAVKNVKEDILPELEEDTMKEKTHSDVETLQEVGSETQKTEDHGLSHEGTKTKKDKRKGKKDRVKDDTQETEIVVDIENKKQDKKPDSTVATESKKDKKKERNTSQSGINKKVGGGPANKKQDTKLVESHPSRESKKVDDTEETDLAGGTISTEKTKGANKQRKTKEQQKDKSKGVTASGSDFSQIVDMKAAEPEAKNDRTCSAASAISAEEPIATEPISQPKAVSHSTESSVLFPGVIKSGTISSGPVLHSAPSDETCAAQDLAAGTSPTADKLQCPGKQGKKQKSKSKQGTCKDASDKVEAKSLEIVEEPAKSTEEPAKSDTCSSKQDAVKTNEGDKDEEQGRPDEGKSSQQEVKNIKQEEEKPSEE